MPATIFAGSKVKALKDRFSLNDATEIVSVTADPASGAGVSAPLGSLALDSVTGKVYRKSGSADTEWQSLGSGLGGINYVENSDAESGVTGWSTYADAAGAQPVDGTGGTPNITWTRSTTTPLRGVADFELAKDAADRQGEGVAYDISVDNADLAKVLTVTFDYEVLSGTYATGDLTVYLIQDPAGTPIVIQPAGYQVQAGTIGTKLKHIATFQTASNVNDYRLCFHVASTSASAYTLAIDNVVVGPQVVQYGAPVTDEKQASGISYEGLGTVTLESVWERRVGNKWHIRGYLKTGTTSASVAAIVLPSGKTIDTSKISSTTNVNRLGTFNRIETGGTATTPDGELFFDGSTTNKLFFCFQSASNQFTKTNGNVLFSSGDGIAFEAEIPILGWSSTVQMSNDTDTRVVAAKATRSVVQSISGPPVTIAYDSISSDTHGAMSTSGVYTVPVAGYYRISGQHTLASVLAAFDANTQLWINGVNADTAGGAKAGTAAQTHTLYFNFSRFLQAGDTIEIKVYHNHTAAINLFGDSIAQGITAVNIERLSGPSAIAASETVAASYYATGNRTPTGAKAVNYDTKVYDTHGAVTTVVGDVAGWKFTAPISGKYRVTITSFQSVALGAGSILVRKNGVAAQIFLVGSTLANHVLNGSGVIQLDAGDYIDIRSDTTPTLNNVTPGILKVFIERIGN